MDFWLEEHSNMDHTVINKTWKSLNQSIANAFGLSHPLKSLIDIRMIKIHGPTFYSYGVHSCMVTPTLHMYQN